MNTSPRSDYATTRWSLVNKAGHGTDEERFAAISKLCEIYQKPLLKFVERRFPEFGDRAEDVHQDFLSNIAHGKIVQRANPNLGKFRNYILAALRDHCVSELRRMNAAKRGGGILHEPLDAADADHPAFELTSQEFTPDAQVQSDMDAVTRARVIDRLRAAVGGDKKREEICLFFLATRGLHNGTCPSRDEILNRHCLSDSAFSNQLRRLGARLEATCRDEVARLVPDSEVEDEMRRILGIGEPL